VRWLTGGRREEGGGRREACRPIESTSSRNKLATGRDKDRVDVKGLEGKS
jgi:hypothetical protein